VQNDDKDDELQSSNDAVTESINTRPLTADEQNVPAAESELQKTPTSSSARSEKAVQPFDSTLLTCC